jgi:predicted ester cyclase
MSEQNKLIARRFIAAFAAGDTATLTQIVAENMIDHGSPPGTKPGRQGLFDAVTMFRAGFPDIQISADRVIAEGESVAVYGRIKGTNTGPLMGSPRQASMPTSATWTCTGSRTVRSWRSGTSRTSPACLPNWD